MLNENIFLGLGSNLGDRASYLQHAIDALSSHTQITLNGQSSVIETEPRGDIEQNQFLNQVVQIESALDPQELLSYCLDIERVNGRERLQKWGPRTLDIDILFFGDEVICGLELTVPHPEVHKRIFMLAM